MKKIVLNYAELPSLLRKPLWRFWHNYILSREREQVVVTFMNYGYAPLSGRGDCIMLRPADEPERFSAQLYHHAVSHTDLAGKEVLEVGCGRGGGASYISRYLEPKRYIGVDLSENGIRFCNTFHASPVLSFVKGDAEKLPFEQNSFDALVNVESSRCYPHIARFFSETYRVLRKGGSFLLTDMRWKKDVPVLREQLKDAGFQVVKEDNITQNVVRALELDDKRRTRLIRRKIPSLLCAAFGEFAGIKGSSRYATFASGDMQYLSYHLKKA